MARGGPPPRRARVGPAPALRGAALPLWHRRPELVAWAESRLDELAALGGNAVQLVVLGRQRDVASIEVTHAPSAPTREELVAVVAAAKRRKLTVLLLPILELEQVDEGAWRGTLRPADPAAWWLSYERFVLHYAALAQDAGVDWLSVGSELGSTEAWRDRWYHLVSQVRRGFAGKLYYSANWDHYQHVTFWSRLDALGVSSYFSLAGSGDDSTAQMAQRWRAALRELAAAARRHELPLLLTEVGVPSRDGAAMAPWDYTRAGRVDLEEQRRAFAALAAAWLGPQIWGALVWELSSEGGADDPGYSPRGKPAWCALAMWWRAAGPCKAGAPLTRTGRRSAPGLRAAR